MFTIDGKSYNVTVPYGSLHRSFEIREGPGSLSYLDGDEDPDIIGTYYHYSLEIDARWASLAEYDSLFETLSAPAKFHTVSFPYGKSGTLTFEARIISGEDELRQNFKNHRKWGNLSVEFRAKKPQRTPT